MSTSSHVTLKLILIVLTFFLYLQSYSQSSDSYINKGTYKITFTCLFENQDYSVYANIGTLSNIEIWKNVTDLPTSFGIDFQWISKLSSYFSINYGLGIRETNHKFSYTWAISSNWDWLDFVNENSIGSYLAFPVDISFSTNTSKRLFFYTSTGISPYLLLNKHTDLKFKNDNYKYLIKPPGSDFKSFVNKSYLDLGFGLRVFTGFSIISTVFICNQSKYYKEDLAFKKHLFAYGFRLAIKRNS